MTITRADITIHGWQPGGLMMICTQCATSFQSNGYRVSAADVAADAHAHGLGAFWQARWPWVVLLVAVVLAAAAWGVSGRASPMRPWRRWPVTAGRATSASWRTWWSAQCC